MGNAVIKINEKEGHEIPTNLQKGPFSIASIHNMDIKTGVLRVFTYFHGTTSSINQDVSDVFLEEPKTQLTWSNTKSLKKLQSFYIDVRPAYLAPIYSVPVFLECKNGIIVEDEIPTENKMWLKETNKAPWLVFHSKYTICKSIGQMYLLCFQYGETTPSRLQPLINWLEH